MKSKLPTIFHTSQLMYIISIFILSACSYSTDEDMLASPEWIDLTHTFDSKTPYWPTAEGFSMDTVFEGMTEKGYYYSAYSFSSAEHGGTHIDAPVHFAEGKQTVDEIPLNTLTGYAAVINVTDAVKSDRDYQVQISDFENWESSHGRIPDGAIILLHTGYDQYWPDKARYMGTDMKGDSAVALLHFPGLEPECAQWLVDNRSIKALGIDTPSIDFGQSSEFKTHRILLAENIPGFENLTNLDKLSAKGDYIIALPMKIKEGSGAPLRIIALKGKH